MGLPKLDIPINLLTWEVSLPDRLEVRQFSGNALAAELFPAAAQNFSSFEVDGTETDPSVWAENSVVLDDLQPGQIGGIIVDPNGAVITGAQVTVQNTQNGASVVTRSNSEGLWLATGMQPGAIRVFITSPGFASMQQELELSASKPARLGSTLQVGAVTEAVTVTSGEGGRSGEMSRESRRLEEQARKVQAQQLNLPSVNVLNLQRRVAGILPVRVDVPRGEIVSLRCRSCWKRNEISVSVQIALSGTERSLTGSWSD